MAEATIKREENEEGASLEDRIIELCQKSDKGVSDAILQAELPGVDVKQRVLSINNLLSLGRLELLKSSGGLLYKVKDSGATRQKVGDNQENLVYQIIEEAGNKGIWVRTIRLRCNLQMVQLTKILKNMESRKLIKAVKSVNASKKKVYMLFGVEPDRSVTGGAWYSEQDFESEFVEVLNQQCYKYLEQKNENAKASLQDPLAIYHSSFASSDEVWKYISELGISKVELSVDDIETILNTLIFDGKAETRLVAAKGDTQSRLYRSVEPLVVTTGLMKTPCGVCPVFNQCCENGEISPAKCIYLDEWLKY